MTAPDPAASPVAEPISERRLRLVVHFRNPTGRRRKNHGTVRFSFDGTRMLARHRVNGDVVAEADASVVSSNGVESWRMVAENGDTWMLTRDCGCGS